MKSAQITERVLVHEAFQGADAVLLFASYRSEVDTTEMIQKALELGKQVYLPKIELNEKTQREEMVFYRMFALEELQPGYKGIREPRAEVRLEGATQLLMLLPGAVFDPEGNRIGYGGGFYDRYLECVERRFRAEPRTKLYKIGLAFECQVVKQGFIPTEQHDARVDEVVTEIGKYCKNYNKIVK